MCEAHWAELCKQQQQEICAHLSNLVGLFYGVEWFYHKLLPTCSEAVQQWPTAVLITHAVHSTTTAMGFKARVCCSASCRRTSRLQKQGRTPRQSGVLAAMSLQTWQIRWWSSTGNQAMQPPQTRQAQTQVSVLFGLPTCGFLQMARPFCRRGMHGGLHPWELQAKEVKNPAHDELNACTSIASQPR